MQAVDDRRRDSPPRPGAGATASSCCGSRTSPSASTDSRRSNDLTLTLDAGRAALHHRSQRRRQDHAHGRHHREDPPDSGGVYLEIRLNELTELSECRIAQLGIGRKFQRPTVFQGTPSTRTCELALRGRQGRLSDALFARLHRRRAGAHRRCSRLIGLAGRRRSGRPGCSRTGRSSGWRSACCSCRSRRCCWSTSRWPA